MGVVTLIGRLVVAWFFIASGAGSVIRAGRVAAHARQRGVPRAREVTQSAGVLMALIGVALAVGLWLDLALILAVVLLVAIAIVMHPFWSVAGLERERMSVQFWKDLALAGALAVWLAYVIDTGDVAFAVTEPLF